MEGYKSEGKEVSVLVNYWQAYGRSFLLITTLVILVFFGNNSYKQYKKNKAENASLLYQQMLVAQYQNNKVKSKLQGEEIIKEFSSTPYALLAGMMLAKNSIDEGKVDEALERFQSSLQLADSNMPLWHVVKIRFARLLHSSGNSEKALEELNTVPDGYVAMYEEIKGDIYLSMNEIAKAKSAYTRAMKHAAEEGKLLLQLKLVDAGVDTSLIKET